MNKHNRGSAWRAPEYPRPRDPGSTRIVGRERSEVATIAYRAEFSPDLSIDCLRNCAAQCRNFADHQSDPKRAELFRGLAASFERHAAMKERRCLTARRLNPG